MTIRIYIAGALLLAAGLAGCSDSVDNFKDRLMAENAQTHDLMNEEALLNVVRASHFEALNFIAVTQFNGGYTQDLKIGLPTVTFGPGQTSVQKQYAFSGNVVDNEATGGWQSNPLVSNTFQQGMSTPISPRQLANLIEAHGREPVLLAAIEQIRVNDTIWLLPNDLSPEQRAEYMKNHNPLKVSHIFRNDPFNNEPDGSDSICSPNKFLPAVSNYADQEAFRGDSLYVNNVLGKITFQTSGDPYVIGDMRKCHFAKFRALLTALLRVGLIVDVNETSKQEQAPQPAAPGKTQNKTQNVTQTITQTITQNATQNAAQDTMQGKFCLNAALVDPPIELIQGPTVLGRFGRCEYVPSSSEQALTPKFRGKDYSQDKEQWGYLEEVSIRLRSPIGIYNYLGEVMRLYNGGKDPAGLFRYATSDAKKYYELREDSAFLNVVEDGRHSGCAVSVEDAGRTYCVKRDDASTLNLLAMLQDLRNLNTQPSDLNSSFTVRVTP